MEKKFLRVSMKEVFKAIGILCGLVGIMAIVLFVASDFDFEVFLDEEIVPSAFIFLIVTLVFTAVYTYQHYNNVLEYGNFGFAVGGATYSYGQVTKLVAVHRGRHGTYYHLYVGDEVVFGFSGMYENKDHFIELLQRNGVLIVA